MKLTDRLMDKNNLSDKLLPVICGMSMSPSVILLQMNLLTDKACKKKKKRTLLTSLHRYFHR